MRRIGLLAGVIVVSLTACGASNKSSKKARAGSNKSGSSSSQTAGGMPGWVNRGTATIQTDGGQRVFYGVGVASGIRNASLLRSTSDNRARKEIAKIFEVFSASLMKDYSASTGEQVVEQAVKTFASASLKGVEVVDRYIGSDGSMYALAALDLQRLKDIAAAERSGAVKTYVEKVDVDDIFDRHGKKPAKPRPPAKVAGKDAGKTKTDTAPADKRGGGNERSGSKPGWVDGYDPSFPNDKYLCGVGFGKNDRTIAENGAFAALSRIFVAAIRSVSQDFMGAYSKTGAESLEVQSSETLTQVATAKVFSGVEIMEIWKAKDRTVYALACLDRPRAAAELRQQISELDQKARRQLENAVKADKASRLKLLAKALNTIVERESLNGELRIVDPNGVGVSGPYAHVDVSMALDAAVEALRIGVQADGRYDTEFRGALTEGLTKRGYKVTDLSEEEAAVLDVLVRATIKIEDGGKGTGSARTTDFARAVIQVEVKNVSSGKIFATFNESRKEGHRNLAEAERRAVRKLAKKLVGQVGTKIDKKMKGI